VVIPDVLGEKHSCLVFTLLDSEVEKKCCVPVKVFMFVVSEVVKNLSVLYVWLIFELTISITYFITSMSVIIPSYFEK
jgi:hypothetical protein